MLKKRFLFLLLGIIVLALSSCGIFKKDCGCPHFGYKQTGNISPRHS
jgi:hypothetical protein